MTRCPHIPSLISSFLLSFFLEFWAYLFIIHGSRLSSVWSSYWAYDFLWRGFQWAFLIQVYVTNDRIPEFKSSWFGNIINRHIFVLVSFSKVFLTTLRITSEYLWSCYPLLCLITHSITAWNRFKTLLLSSSSEVHRSTSCSLNHCVQIRHMLVPHTMWSSVVTEMTLYYWGSFISVTLTFLLITVSGFGSSLWFFQWISFVDCCESLGFFWRYAIFYFGVYSWRIWNEILPENIAAVVTMDEFVDGDGRNSWMLVSFWRKVCTFSNQGNLRYLIVMRQLSSRFYTDQLPIWMLWADQKHTFKPPFFTIIF